MNPNKLSFEAKVWNIVIFFHLRQKYRPYAARSPDERISHTGKYLCYLKIRLTSSDLTQDPMIEIYIKYLNQIDGLPKSIRSACSGYIHVVSQAR